MQQIHHYPIYAQEKRYVVRVCMNVSMRLYIAALEMLANASRETRERQVREERL